MIASGVGQEREKAHGANASFGFFFLVSFFLVLLLFFSTSFSLSSLVDLCSNSQAGTAEFRGTLGQHV